MSSTVISVPKKFTMKAMVSESTLQIEQLSAYSKDLGLAPSELSIAEPRKSVNIDRSGATSLRKVSDKQVFYGNIFPAGVYGLFGAGHYEITNNNGESVSTTVGVHQLSLKGEPYFLVAAIRDEGGDPLGRRQGQPTVNENFGTLPIVNVFIVKEDDLYSSVRTTDKFIPQGSFQLDVTYDQLKAEGFLEEYRNTLKIQTVFTGIQRFIFMYFDYGKRPGIRIPLVTDELLRVRQTTLSSDNTLGDIDYLMLIRGGYLTEMEKEYGGDFSISTAPQVPVVVSTKTAMYFSEHTDTIRGLFLSSNEVGQVPTNEPKVNPTNEQLTAFKKFDETYLRMHTSGGFVYKSEIKHVPNVGVIAAFVPKTEVLLPSTKDTLSDTIYVFDRSYREHTTSYRHLKRFRILLRDSSGDYQSDWTEVNILNPLEPFTVRYLDAPVYNASGAKQSTRTFNATGIYSHTSGMFKIKIEALDAFLTEEPKFSGIDVIYADDAILFQKNRLDIVKPYLFPAEVAEPPKVAILENNMFFVEGSTLKYYSVRNEDVSVLAEDLTLVENLIQTVENGVFLLAKTQDEIHAYLIKRGIVGSQSYQVYRLGRLADFKQYDFTSAKISEYGSQVAIFCKRISDRRDVVIRLESEVGTNNQYEDGYLVNELDKEARFVTKTGDSITYLGSEGVLTNTDINKTVYRSNDYSYTVFHADNEAVDGEWVSYYDKFGSNLMKTIRFLTLTGKLNKDAKIGISVSFDGEGYVPVGEATYEDTSGDPLSAVPYEPVGVDTVGSEDVGGEPQESKTVITRDVYVEELVKPQYESGNNDSFTATGAQSATVIGGYFIVGIENSQDIWVRPVDGDTWVRKTNQLDFTSRYAYGMAAKENDLTLFVGNGSQGVFQKIFAYTFNPTDQTLTRKLSHDVDTGFGVEGLAYDNKNSRLFVATATAITAYSVTPSGVTADTGYSITVDSKNTDIRGIAVAPDIDHLYTFDTVDGKAYCYQSDDGARSPHCDFNLEGNTPVGGFVYKDHIYIANSSDKKLYAYRYARTTTITETIVPPPEEARQFDITLPITRDLQKTFLAASVKLDFSGSYCEVSSIGIGKLILTDKNRRY